MIKVLRYKNYATMFGRCWFESDFAAPRRPRRDYYYVGRKHSKYCRPDAFYWYGARGDDMHWSAVRYKSNGVWGKRIHEPQYSFMTMDMRLRDRHWSEARAQRLPSISKKGGRHA